MALDFPASPVSGQTFAGPGGLLWQYDGAKWVNGTAVGTAYAPIASPNFTGDPKAPTAAAGDSDTSLATTAFVQTAVAPIGNNTGRNLIHNGQFNITQRGAGPWTAGNTADRWPLYVGPGDTSTVTIYSLVDADRSQIGDEAAQFTPGIQFTGGASSTAQTTLLQNIENVRRTGGKTLTLSFWARNVGGSAKLGVAWSQNFGTGGSPSSTVSGNLGVTPLLTGSFVRYTLTATLPSINGKTVGSNGDSSLGIQFFFSCSPSNPNTGVAGGIGAQSGNTNLWGIQLEIGSAATPLAKRDPADELALCQRFYVSMSLWFQTYSAAGVPVGQTITLPVAMRGAPTVAFTGMSYTNCSGAALANVSSVSPAVYATATALGTIQFTGTFTASADL